MKRYGEIEDFTPEGFIIKVAGGAVEILEVQAQGSRRMSAADYSRGYRVLLGEVFC